MNRFDPDRYYTPKDPEMRLLGSERTLMYWRQLRKGPQFAKLGGRVVYLGADLNRYIDDHTVETQPVAA